MTGEPRASTWRQGRSRFPVATDTFRRGGTKPNLSRSTDAPAATAFSDPKPSAQSPIDAADPPALSTGLAGAEFTAWVKGGYRDLNPRHPDPQSGALPTEL